MSTARKKPVEEFDRIFDEGKEDIIEYVDLSKAVTVNPSKETKKVNVDFPSWMVDSLDKEAERLAIPRQAVIKMLVDEGLARRNGRSA